MAMHEVYLGLGSNLGDCQQNLTRAIEYIGSRVGTVVKKSSFYETEPWGFESDNRFLNAVVCAETMLSPRELLLATQQIERELGKTKAHTTIRRQSSAANAQPYSFRDRPIDIDILLYDDLHVDEPDLKIPHPLMEQRDFVMKPLLEIKSK